MIALAFAPDGDELVSTGLDGKLCHWGLRPDACFVSSAVVISGHNKRGMERGGGGGEMDPSVALGGRLLPTCFTGGGTTSKSPSQRRR